ncbi:MAG: YraN family protein, partial [Stenotrophobium sp.]
MSRRLGALAEARAAEFLQRLGYRVVDRNWACRGGEIDLVCLDGDGTLVF